MLFKALAGLLPDGLGMCAKPRRFSLASQSFVNDALLGCLICKWYQEIHHVLIGQTGVRVAGHHVFGLRHDELGAHDHG
ncbi:hypothetical protein D3C87_2143140 [compost metagenome]